MAYFAAPRTDESAPKLKGANQRSGRPAIDELTSLRGLAALWVVSYHYAKDIFVLFPMTVAPFRFMIFGDFGVDFFFTLSGFVIAYNYADQFRSFSVKSYGQFLLARLARIYPVHLVTLLAVLGMAIAAKKMGMQLDWEGYTAGRFVQNILLIHAWLPHYILNWNYPSWSISVEWLLYLCFPFFALKLATLRSRAATLFLLIVLIATVEYTGARLYGFPFRDVLRGFLQFLSGYLIYKFSTQTRFEGETWRSLAAWVLISGYFLAPIGLEHPEHVLLALSPLLIGVLTLTRGRDPGLTAKPILYLGEISYSLYMTHTLALRLTTRLLPAKNFVDSNLGVRLGVVLSYAIAIGALSWLTYYFVEVPARRYFRRRAARAL